MTRFALPLLSAWLTVVAGVITAPPLSAAPPAGAAAAADGVTVEDAWARASAGAATTGAAYVMLMAGARPDALVGASTPVAASAEVHESVSRNGVMTMRAVPSLPLPAGKMITFTPGGYHVMLMGLTKPLVAGDSFPLTLTFQNAPPVTVTVKVRPLGGKAPDMGHMHMD